MVVSSSSTATFTKVLGLLWSFLPWSLLLGGLSATSYGQTYSAGFNNSRWVTASSPFSCSLSHKIPKYGVATFSRKAGSSEVFELQQDEVILPMSLITIEAVPPSWRNDLAPVNLGQTQALAGKTVIRLSPSQLPPLMAQLEKGMQVLFSSNQLSTKGTNVRVGIEAQQFPAAYKKYKHCIAQLIPYSFQQVARVTMTYASGAEVLSAATKAQLDKIVRYAKADPRVLGVIVDAHSEKLIDPATAEAISKIQAELVVAYLVERGLPAGKITARWHGDKFPIASNLSAIGKAQNRRVTVRLESEATRRQTEQKIADRKAAEEKIAANKAAAEKKAEEDLSAQTPMLKRLVELVEEQDLNSGKQPELEKSASSSP